MLGLVITEITNPSIALQIKIIEEEISKTDYSFMMSVFDGKLREERDCIREMTKGLTEGMILPTIEKESEAELKYLNKNKIPYVLVIRRLYDLKTHFVGVDNEYGSYLMMNHLFDIGYREIGFIKGIEEVSVSKERFNGYRSFIKERNMPFRDDLVEIGNFKYEDAYRAAAKIIRNNSKLQAIFCANDYSALGAMDAASKLGKKVPENLAIVGFDDIPIAGYSNINMTTIKVPFRDIVRKAMEILLNELEKPKAKKEVFLFKPSLVVRKSCGSN